MREPIQRLAGVSRVTVNDRLVLSEAIPVSETADTGDFNRFYRVEADRLFKALAIALGDVDLAREAVDEGMVRAYQRWKKVGAYDSPAGWVYRVSLNWARNRVRNRQREVLTTEWSDEAVVDDIDPDLQRALDTLSVDARSVVVLRYLLGWSTADTAQALGVTPGTVKSRLSRALDRLETLLEER